jgi:hypothetical protein
LFPFIQEGLKPGGVVIFHTLLESDNVEKSQEHCREYLLRKNELLHAFLMNFKCKCWIHDLAETAFRELSVCAP